MNLTQFGTRRKSYISIFSLFYDVNFYQLKGGINVDEIRVGSQDWGFMGIIKVNDLNKAT